MTAPLPRKNLLIFTFIALTGVMLGCSSATTDAKKDDVGTAARPAPLPAPPPPPATPDQLYACNTPRWQNDHFIINIGAKTVKGGDEILGAGKPIDFTITDVNITDDSIAFVQRLNENLGGATLVLVKHVTISRKDGTYTAKDESNPSPAKGKCTVKELNAH